MNLSKPIYLTRHAVERALKYDLAPELVEHIIGEGERVAEGKTKARYVLRAKKGVWVVVCEEYSDQIVVVTITKGR